MSTKNEQWIKRERIRAALRSMDVGLRNSLQRVRDRGDEDRAYGTALLQRECGDIGHEWDEMISFDGHDYRRCRTCLIVDVSGVRMESERS